MFLFNKWCSLVIQSKRYIAIHISKQTDKYFSSMIPTNKYIFRFLKSYGLIKSDKKLHDGFWVCFVPC